MTELLTTLVRFLFNIPPWAFVFPDENGILLRGGKYKKTLTAGFYLKWPLYDRVQKIYIKEQIVNLPNQSVTTIDGTVLAISGTIRYEVSDGKKALLNVLNYDQSLQNLGLGTIAAYVSRVSQNSCTYSEIEREVLDELQSESEDWGLEILDFKLTDLAVHKVYRIMTQDMPLLLPQE